MIQDLTRCPQESVLFSIQLLQLSKGGIEGTAGLANAVPLSEAVCIARPLHFWSRPHPLNGLLKVTCTCVIKAALGQPHSRLILLMLWQWILAKYSKRSTKISYKTLLKLLNTFFITHIRTDIVHKIFGIACSLTCRITFVTSLPPLNWERCYYEHEVFKIPYSFKLVPSTSA